jgi:hypothetical protein
MSLSKSAMLAAVFAEASDNDPDFSDGLSAVRGRADIHYGDDNKVDKVATEAGIARDVALYTEGKAVLRHYKVSYSKRTAVPYSVDGKPMVDIPNGASFVLVSAGHIATSQAYRFAMFSKR